jgi:glyoxylase-like metal-dependent hydrolase (beta-lactamase superfamily II)
MSTITRPTGTLTIDTFRAEGEGCLGYLAVDEVSRTAMAIDPRLDHVAQFQKALTARGARLAYVLDTHTHADHLSGVRALAARTGARILAHAASKLTGSVDRVGGGATFDLGSLMVRILDARGHTPDSLAVLVEGHLFTGDALFAGSAGRTDFMGGSASDLFDTFRRFEALPDDTVVHPGHDYGGGAVTSIGGEKGRNALFQEHDRAAFVSRLSIKAPPPANMTAILRHNVGEDSADTVDAGALHALMRGPGGVAIVDVRSPLEFESEHIEGAVNVPLDLLDTRVEEFGEGADLVVVCRTGVRATIAAETLGRAGRRARVLEGGMLAWRREGLPVREGRKRLPVDRQVQLIAGTMVLAGVALGTLVNPWFLALSAFFGAGLTFAGATGTCGLALVLLKMPWNRPLAPPPSGGAVCAAGATATCAAPMSPPPPQS